MITTKTYEEKNIDYVSLINDASRDDLLRMLHQLVPSSQRGDGYFYAMSKNDILLREEVQNIAGKIFICIYDAMRTKIGNTFQEIEKNNAAVHYHVNCMIVKLLNV